MEHSNNDSSLVEEEVYQDVYDERQMDEEEEEEVKEQQEARRDSVSSILKLLALLAVKSHGPFPKKASSKLAKDEAKIFGGKPVGAKQARLLAYVESLSETLAMHESSAAQIQAMVEMACQEAGLVHQLDRHDFVVVRTVRDLIHELSKDVRAVSSPSDSGWLALVMKIMITSQVRRNLYDARARASFKHLVRKLDLLPWKEVAAIESGLAAEFDSLIRDDELDPQGCHTAARYVKVALAAFSGGALMLYTGSMAAPSIAASLFALCTAGGTLTQISTNTAALMAYWGLTSTSAISSIFAATGVGLTGYKMSKRTQGITEFHFVPLHSNFPLQLPRAISNRITCEVSSSCSTLKETTGLPVFVCIPGWVEEGQDPRRVWGGGVVEVDMSGKGGKDGEQEEVDNFQEADDAFEMVSMVEENASAAAVPETEGEGPPQRDMMDSWEALEMTTSGWWRECVPYGEEHVLIWETTVLGQLHKAMKEFMWNEGIKYAWDEVIKHTALASLTTAAALPMSVLDAARKLDNPWQMAVFHAEEAGRLLANILVSRPQGSRPVTLLGFSMGARVIFHCLEALYEKGEAGLGIIENAVLLGTPIGRTAERWRKCRSVVAGRLINGYSTQDWVLTFLFRTKAWELGLAGIAPVEIEGAAGGGAGGPEVAEEGEHVENVDLSDMVAGHLLYPKALPNIMAKLRLED